MDNLPEVDQVIVINGRDPEQVKSGIDEFMQRIASSQKKLIEHLDTEAYFTYMLDIIQSYSKLHAVLSQLRAAKLWEEGRDAGIRSLSNSAGLSIGMAAMILADAAILPDKHNDIQSQIEYLDALLKQTYRQSSGIIKIISTQHAKMHQQSN